MGQGSILVPTGIRVELVDFSVDSFWDGYVVFHCCCCVFVFCLAVSLQFDWISESSRQTAARSAVSKQSQHWKVSPNLQTGAMCLVGG